MRWRSRWLALSALVLHFAALVGLPLLHERAHQRGHERRHQHLGTETRWTPGEADEAGHETADPGTEPLAPEALHLSHDADLEALDLLDVGHAGVAAVDCALARYTLAECASPDAPSHGFGDELLARTPHHHRAPQGAPWEPGHGAHSLEHGGLAVAGTPLFLLPPPRRTQARAALPAPPLLRGFSPHLALRARAPPRIV